MTVVHPSAIELRAALPAYECHKRVHAAPITAWARGADRFGKDACLEVTIDVDGEDKVLRFDLELSEFAKRFRGTDRDMGVLVVYEDGFISWSPSEAFRKGYARETPEPSAA